jgi:hypothetical protein
MRTKTLLIAAAALVAGVASSEAQVYSANIVGYVNAIIPANQLTLVANPLDDGTNTITSLGAGLPNKSQVQIWNGAGYNGSSKAAGAWTVNLPIPVGTGFFVKSPTAITNTFVGNVVTPTGGSATNSLPAGSLVLVGSMIPYSGDLTDTNLNLGPSLPNKSQIQVWNGTGFVGSSKAAGSWTVPFTLTVGEGFFVKSASATNWVQTLPAN